MTKDQLLEDYVPLIKSAKDKYYIIVVYLESLIGFRSCEKLILLVDNKVLNKEKIDLIYIKDNYKKMSNFFNLCRALDGQNA
ncbi:hypothetical protein BpHYR1_019422 [Brachionus plicatilis]|uniref:Uncharacterized protein n=1 Tax=Brachionus plicatilis TaxID=10195 RepID=A0A3M7RDC2_BRAPC|nr:hypothetical protein BpHYR1_019422 [Brachionus plicatilis]